MSLIAGNQNDRLLAIYKVLPDLEKFLRETLAHEQLSEEANAKREEFLSKLENLNRPPDLPPRGSTKPVNISEQRALSWRMTPSPYPATPAPYQSRKRHTSDDSFAEQSEGRPSLTDDGGIYEKIPSENGSGKYVDVNKLESDGKPPIPERAGRFSTVKPPVIERDGQRHSWNDGNREIFTRDLPDPNSFGPLKELREHTKYWYVLKNKKLYVFKDVQGPCSQVLDIGLYDVFPQKTDFRLTRPGYPPLILEAENDEDHTRWTAALEKCKYEELDEIIPIKYRTNLQRNDELLLEDPDYEMPIQVIEKMERLERDKPKSPADVYVDMHANNDKKPADDYVDPTKRSPFYESLENLTYDAELPPIPLSSDEEPLGEYDDKFKVPNGHTTGEHSDGRISGPFDTLSSSSGDEPEPPALPPRSKERSSTDPPSYNTNNTYANSLDRKISTSLGRKFEKELFFSDPDALHVGMLHKRRVLAVWQKRYCKVKNEMLIVYRNPDKDEKPALEISLQDLQFVVCDKETWRSHSFKVTLPSAETYYFAAETHEQLVTWLNVLVKERDRLKYGAKDANGRDRTKDFLSPNNGIEDNESTSSLEQRDVEEGSHVSDSDTESIASADSEASDKDDIETDRKKSLKKRSSFQKSQSQNRRLNQEFDIDGNLYMEASGKWQRYWCKIEATKLEIYASKSSKSSELSIALLESNLVLLPKSVMEQSTVYIIKIVANESEVNLLANDQREWKKWISHIKKYATSVRENAELHKDLPELPASGKGERKPRTKKKPLKNGNALPIDVSDVAQDRKQYNGQLVQFKEVSEETGNDVFCEIRGGFFILANDNSMEKKTIEIPVRKVRIEQKVSGRNDFQLFQFSSVNEVAIILGVKEKQELRRLVETLWLQNAQVEGEKGTFISDNINQLKKQFKRRSITFDTELKDLERGDRSSSLPRYKPKLNEDKAASDSEPIGTQRQKISKSPVDSKKPQKAAGKQSSSSRVSAFFRSLPRRKQKKYDFTDVVDGMPKTQFSGTVTEVRVDDSGVETSNECHCKVSGKIFYAYELTNDVKPIFKVPLRSATIEDGPAEKGEGRYRFAVSSMEDKSIFKFEVEGEEDFDNWYNALYMIDNRSNPGKMSSRESLLDEMKSDADADMKPEVSTPLFSGSNSNSSLSSVLSKQAKSIAGSGDETKAEAPPTRKISEEVFAGGPETIKQSGFLYEVKQSETNGIKSRTKLRRWCVLRQSWVEIYSNKNDKVPLRGIAIGHHTIEPISTEESGEKWAMSLRSDEELIVLCANNEDDYCKWQQELKKVTKKRTRLSSDVAKLKLKSASDGIKQLLSSSSLPGLPKRDSKRNTIVLNETDEKLVHDFTADIESGNKISGILMITLVDEKVVKPKKRYCLIRDGKFCIAKRSKPQKFMKTIDLSKVAILDECDIDKEVFGFRLDFGPGESMAFQAANQKTADDWMVAISMAILLEKLTSPDKFPQQGDQLGDVPETDDNFGPDVDELGLIDVSQVVVKENRGSESSNFSNDIKAAIDQKISVGSSYLNPLSNLLESAFTPGPYSESSSPSSREGTLERDVDDRKSARNSSGGVIPEEEREDSDDQASGTIKAKVVKNDVANSNTTNALDIDNEIPRPGSVSKAIASYETLNSRPRPIDEDSVFHNEAADTQVEEKLADLLKKQEELEKERNVILDRLPDLRNEVETARIRREKGSVSTDKQVIEEEYATAKMDLGNMEKRLNRLEKELNNVKGALQKKTSKLKDPFRRRSAVISPHVIV